MRKLAISLAFAFLLAALAPVASQAQKHGGHGGASHGYSGGHGYSGRHGHYYGGHGYSGYRGWHGYSGRRDHGWYGGVYLGTPWVYPYPYWYAYPYWRYPYYYPAAPYSSYPSPLQDPSSVYIQREAPPPAQTYWYYCASAKAYYPTVQRCAEAWIKVPPRPE